jgi:hypothetical protein
MLILAVEHHLNLGPVRPFAREIVHGGKFMPAKKKAAKKKKKH